MADNDLTLDQVRALAHEADLERFSEEHLQQLTRAANAARARRKQLPVERLTYADEPACIFRLRDEEAR